MASNINHINLKDLSMRKANVRKQYLNNQVDLVNSGELSLEGFFDFLFGKKKEEKKKPNLGNLIFELEKAEKVSIDTQFKSFQNYYKSLVDLEGPLLDFQEKNLRRVTDFLELHNKYRDKIGEHLDEAVKLGSPDTVAKKGPKGYFFKSKYYLATFISRNNEPTDFEEYHDTEYDFSKEQKNVLSYPSALCDTDFSFLHTTDSKENITVEINETEKNKLIEILKRINNRLPQIKEKAAKLRKLIEEVNEDYVRNTLAKHSIDKDIIDDEYAGFGGSMHQGMGYLYEIELGLEKDLYKEIKLA